MLTRIYDFFFHRHKWILKDDFPLYNISASTERPCGRGYIFQCEKCGKIKYKNIIF